jgi:hypothetical protein
MKPLAPELLEAIVAEVRSPETLLQLRTASSYLNTLATPLAFRSICFINKDKSLERFKRIANYDRDKLAQHIREVIYQYEEADPSSFEIFWSFTSISLSLQLVQVNPCAHTHYEDSMGHLLWKRLPSFHSFPPWSLWF